MSTLLEKLRAEYVRIYGKTVPAYAHDMACPVFKPQPVSGYKGCHIENSTITFEFSTPKEFNSIFDKIEMQFRNRLSHKISFSSGDNAFSVFISDFIEERGEYLTTAIDLDNYFRGKDATLKLRAESNLHRAHKDWRNPELVEQEIKKICEENKK